MQEPDTTDPMGAPDRATPAGLSETGIEATEGSERLFHYNQFMVSTYYYAGPQSGTIVPGQSTSSSGETRSRGRMAKACPESWAWRSSPASRRWSPGCSANRTSWIWRGTSPSFPAGRGQDAKIVRGTQLREYTETGQTRRRHGEADQRAA